MAEKTPSRPPKSQPTKPSKSSNNNRPLRDSAKNTTRGTNSGGARDFSKRK